VADVFAYPYGAHDARVRTLARAQFTPHVKNELEAYRAWIAFDAIATALIGVFADDLLRRGPDAVNDENFNSWMARHGCSSITLDSCLIQTAYDSSFALVGGNRPDMEAGTILRGAVRMFLMFKGSVSWRFAAGTGDTIFAPLYLVLKKRGVKFEEFAVASGNLTMQQMVARQVDMGTYAAQSFIIGHDKGGLVAIAQIEYVGKTAQIVARKDLNITKVEELRGRKVANQTGSSIGNVFVDIIAPKAGLKKGDFQEVRMDVNNMAAALAAKTVDAFVGVEPYNEIAVAEGFGVSLMDFSSIDKMPVFMAATPDFVQKNPDTVVAYLEAWQEVAGDFKNNPTKVSDLIYSYFSSKGFNMSRETLAKALARVEVNPGFPAGLEPDLRRDAEVLLREKKIDAIPDWKKALRPDLWAKAVDLTASNRPR